jgi:hypothetical protein
VFQGKYSPYRDPAVHPLDWWAASGGLAAEIAAAAAASGTPGSHLPALPARTYAGPLDVDAAAVALKAELDAAGVTGAPGAARGRRGYFLSYVETDPLYPFQRIRFADGSDTGVVALIAPFYDTNYFRAETQRALFWRLKARGHIIVGVSSYQVCVLCVLCVRACVRVFVRVGESIWETKALRREEEEEREACGGGGGSLPPLSVCSLNLHVFGSIFFFLCLVI